MENNVNSLIINYEVVVALRISGKLHESLVLMSHKTSRSYNIVLQLRMYYFTVRKLVTCFKLCNFHHK